MECLRSAGPFYFKCLNGQGQQLFRNILLRIGPLDPYFNFLTFGNAVLTLFRVASGDQWYDVMLAFMARHPECTTEQQSYEELLAEGPKNCGDYLSTLAFFFFTVFTVQYVSMNLFVGCVIDGYLEVMLPLIPWPSFTSFP